MSALISKPGLSSATTLSIPKDWDKTWFRNLISNQLKGADVRNAVGANGITVTGTIASPYAKISLGPGPVVLNTAAGTVALTVNGATGQPALVVNGDEVLSGGLQITGYDTSGFVGAGIEIGLASGTGYVQAYNRTTTAWLPLILDGLSASIYVGGSTATSLVLSTNATFLTMSNSSAGYSSAYGGVAGIIINNASSAMQSVLDFGKAGVISGRIRNDYVGNMTYVATGTGVHGFYYGGDSGAGTAVAAVNANGFSTGVATYLMQSSVAWTNGAGTTSPTLGATGPAGATTPTKWIAINDNGTVRHIPAW